MSKKPYPETIDELVARCEELSDRYDLYTLGEYSQNPGWPDGTEDLSGEYAYGVAMIPAKWVTHVLNKQD